MARQPVVYLPHGGGPWPFVDLPGLIDDADELAALTGYLRDGVRRLSPTRPRALLVVSAHWEAATPTVMSAQRPPMLYDYYGFPPESYRIQWPAPGDPALAARVRTLVEEAGFTGAALDGARGFDHGTFIPLKLTFPDADVPTVQLSLVDGLDPARHLALGRALRPLRDDGVLIVGSGMSFHNLRAFFAKGPGVAAVREAAREFDRWLQRVAVLPARERDAALVEWERAPAARLAHPREEHLLPLMVMAGAAGDDVGTIGFSGTWAGFPLTAVEF